jgi:rare lipoprotein A
MKPFLLLCIAAVFICSCSPSPRYTIGKIKGKTPSVKIPENAAKEELQPVESLPVGTKIRGLASYYADDYNGKPTSNGEIFDMYGLTCAHRTLPFQTWLEVKNLSNGKTVIVRVNDRGPFIEGRIIDLSYGAAKEIDMLGSGVEEVEIVVIK